MVRKIDYIHIITVKVAFGGQIVIVEILGIDYRLTRLIFFVVQLLMVLHSLT